MRIFIFLFVLFAMGSASLPPSPPSCKPDPFVNSQVEDTIKAVCAEDCVKIKDPNCKSDCTSFAKWGIKYGDDK